ncbi:MAG TPA: tripartite tricarboxylate transporter permease, partial [Clostridiales bacterium]|nr:tripartite tricarboxylate transporter permease [Clostridiales bacterium]
MSAEVWISALQTLMQPSVLFFLLAGVLIGTVIGALPGLSATMGVAIMTPITFWFSPTNGFAMLMGLWNAAIFAGGISAILVNTPGTPASITQTFDGYALYRQGKGGLALGINVIFSAIGGLFSTFCLILFANPIARFTVTFGPAEYFMLALFGLSMMVAVSGEDILKGLIVGAAGILLSCVGLDPILSVKRFTLGQSSLLAGISFIPVMIGMFGIGEVLYQMYSRRRKQEAEEMEARKVNLKLGKVLPSAK